MATKNKVYVAGVGLSPSTERSGPFVLSAAVKALLDAGVTYDHVSKSLVSKDVTGGKSTFAAFNDDRVIVDLVANRSLLGHGIDEISGARSQCVLIAGVDKEEAVAFVLVSEDFLMRWPYLKDSSMLVSKVGRSDGSLSQAVRKVWRLRGWGSVKGASPRGESSIELARADGQSTPKWKDVECKLDGKHRLGYNPATETKQVSQEDLEAVQATGKTQQKTSAFKRRGGDLAILTKQHDFVAKL
ncbi:uncharacterized protein AB675_2271 [Cyphellophora attinorum]|uniref:Uncharacterized protein n=1 Tax=Cyphellophora attinorum TaxID=1664694 RepID=A0A0N0NHZ9_9EURO|nr:uncharacterized protein AB675_2271 [Phialophora attinorum]KPI34869.1 hypothetical protein AB675_2271 [Phialophora attinorum]